MPSTQNTVYLYRINVLFNAGKWIFVSSHLKYYFRVRILSWDDIETDIHRLKSPLKTNKDNNESFHILVHNRLSSVIRMISFVSQQQRDCVYLLEGMLSDNEVYWMEGIQVSKMIRLKN